MAGKNKNSNEIKVLMVGFFLIVFVSGLFFLKNHSEKKFTDPPVSDEQTSSPGKNNNFTGLSASELEKKINARENIVIFDLRMTDSFDLGHILDSKNVSIDYLAQAVSSEDSPLDAGLEYVFVDELGLTPSQLEIMKVFSSAGFEKISYLEGGILGWENDLRPMITFGNPYSLEDQSKVTYVQSDDLKSELSSGHEKILLIDVRSKMEYVIAHIPGAINIPLDELESRRREMRLGKKTVLYDNNGVGAFQGGVRLFDSGVIGTYVLSDGFNSWKQKNYPVAAGQ